jgi:EmrB/QacA subfamily drug resistance transporter
MTFTPVGATTRQGKSLVVLTILCLAQFMLIVDVVVVNVALPSIRSDLNLPDSRLQLVAVAYTLTFGSLLVAAGRAGDLLGRRRLFTVGLALFTLASLLTALAQFEWQLLAARAGQGVGAALVSPAALALLTTAFDEGAARNRALGYWAAVGSAGAIAGQVIGGFLTDAYGWRSIFLINVPIGVLVLAGALRYLPESRGDDRAKLDVRGAILLTGGLAAAILALTLLAEGQSVMMGLLLTAAAMILGYGMLTHSRRHPAPLLDPTLIRMRGVAKANLLLAVNAGMLGGTLLFTTLYMQVILDYSPFEMGAAFAPVTLLILLISPKAGALTTRFGARRMLTTGFSLLAVGMALLARLPQDGTYLTAVLPALLLIAIGSGLAYAPTFIAGTTGVPDRLQGLASGFLNSSQELGAAIGVTTLGAVATIATTGDSLVTGYRAGLMTAAGVVALSILIIRRLPTENAVLETSNT